MEMWQFVPVLAVIMLVAQAQLCTRESIKMVARVVYGESRGEPEVGQRAVAYTMVNRISHAGYPNTLREVVFQKASNNHHQYETLDLPGHNAAWEQAKAQRDVEYVMALKTAASALCKRMEDPTYCATDFCNVDPCPATSSNQYWDTFNKTKIGGHYFVCRRPAASG